jgi:hypothetical protein
MKQEKVLSFEKRARMTAIGDLLLERYVEQKEALEGGDRAHAIELQFEIKELMREKEKIAEAAACPLTLRSERKAALIRGPGLAAPGYQVR